MPCTTHARIAGRRFCPTCHKVYDPDELRAVGARAQARFLGCASLALEKYWHTGNPLDADKPDR